MDSLNRAITTESPFTANLKQPRLHSPLPMNTGVRLHSPLPGQLHTTHTLSTSPTHHINQHHSTSNIHQPTQFRSLAHSGAHSPSINLHSGTNGVGLGLGLGRHYGLHHSSSLTDIANHAHNAGNNNDHNIHNNQTSPNNNQQQQYSIDNNINNSSAVQCPHCSLSLIIPSNATDLVMCPQCQNCFKAHPHRNAICIGCQAQLAYPADAQYIQWYVLCYHIFISIIRTHNVYVLTHNCYCILFSKLHHPVLNVK